MFRPFLSILERFPSSRPSRNLVNCLRLVWIIVLLHGEYYIFWKAARRCAPWPTDNPSTGSLDRILLVGDPQMTDAYSYDRPGVILRISEFYSDIYMDRNYRHLSRQLDPQATLFIGDLMDGGREWDDAGYQNQVQRFKRLFQSSKPQYFMAGNHDIGFGNGIKSHVLKRFEENFGPTSYSFNTTDYSIVVLDTVSLSATNDLDSKQNAFDLLDRHLPPHPRILFTHVPLYRPPGTSCGPERQSPKGIRQGRGYQYQNLVGENLSNQILERVDPVAIFSGDDHDYCVVNHMSGRGQVPEMTIPTFSMAQGVRYPGVVLLDLTRGDQGYFATKLCWLPDQISIFIGYGCLVVASLAVLGVAHAYRLTRQRRQRGFDKSYDEDALPNPAVMVPRVSPLKRGFSMFLKDVSDVATVGILFYVFSIVIL